MQTNVPALKQTFADDVAKGLSAPEKYIPAQYFYDPKGSGIFVRITQLPAYYLPGCEREILYFFVRNILPKLERRFNILELGPGDGLKAFYMIQTLLEEGREVSYCPVDISPAALEQTRETFKEGLKIDVPGFTADFFDNPEKLVQATKEDRQNLFLLLGSSLGNLRPARQIQFLKGIRQILFSAKDRKPDLVLLGLDLQKDPEILLRAYADTEGLTAEFNLNLLQRINTELGGDFNLNQFRHLAVFHPEAMESYLVSQTQQVVQIQALNRTFSFQKGEKIHTECSCKFTQTGIEELAKASGFRVIARELDPRGYFINVLLELV